MKFRLVTDILYIIDASVRFPIAPDYFTITVFSILLKNSGVTPM